MRRTYFLVNDTRFDNHHGCLSVVRNLHLGMSRRGWHCIGSLPVSAKAESLHRHHTALANADLVIVNGEGSLHDDSRNAMRLHGICSKLVKSHPVAIINTVWQGNSPDRWQPLIERLIAVYTRDRRSQQALQSIRPDTRYAPDLTFYEYPRFAVNHRARYLCTDSRLESWTALAIEYCRNQEHFDFLTLFTKRQRYTRGIRDWERRLKHTLIPDIAFRLRLRIAPKHEAMRYAIDDTDAFLRRLSSYAVVCAARYHSLCFCIQQRVPFVAVRSNSHKSEALIEEIGLPEDIFLFDPADMTKLKERMDAAAMMYPRYLDRINKYNLESRRLIDEMLDHLDQALNIRS